MRNKVVSFKLKVGVEYSNQIRVYVSLHLQESSQQLILDKLSHIVQLLAFQPIKKETTFGLLITFVLVSKRYLSMTSLSPENQPSSLPPDLTTLVFILFDVAGVDYMIAEKRGKGLHTKKARDVARDGSIDCFYERELLHQIL